MSLKGAFNIGFYEKRLRLQQKDGKFLFKTDLLTGILFIFDNNVVAKSLKPCKKCYVL